MKKRTSIILFAALTLAAMPGWAGIHYKAKTSTDGAGKDQAGNVSVEAWVSGGNARIEFQESSNPMARKGTYLITKDGGKTLYLVNPEDKTYAEWDLQAMMGMVGGIMNGMGPLLKIQFTDPKVEKLLDEDGGSLLGVPTRHTRHRTSYSMTVKVFGMGNTSDVLQEQDIWSTTKLQEAAMGAWLRSDPPRTGNAEFDKLLAKEAQMAGGIPLKMVTVSTTTPKKGEKTVTRQTMEVTQLDTNATVAASKFEIPSGYEETRMELPTAGNGGEGQDQGGLGGLLRGRKGKDGGNR